MFNYGIIVFMLCVLIFLFWGLYYIYKSPNQEEVFIRELKNMWGLVYDCLDKVGFIPIYGLIFANIFCKINVECYGSKLIIYIK